MNKMIKIIHGQTDQGPIKGLNFIQIINKKQQLNIQTTTTMMKQFAFAATLCAMTMAMGSS